LESCFYKHKVSFLVVKPVKHKRGKSQAKFSLVECYITRSDNVAFSVLAHGVDRLTCR